MDADGQQHTSAADTPARSALCVDAQPRSWKQPTSFADVRTIYDEDGRCLRQLCRQLMAPVKGLVPR